MTRECSGVWCISVWDEEGGGSWRRTNGDQVQSNDAFVCLKQKTDVEHKRWKENWMTIERTDTLKT